MAERVGIGRLARRAKVPLRFERNSATLEYEIDQLNCDLCEKTICNLLFRRHAYPLLQIRARAKGSIAFTREDQRPRASLPTFPVQTLDHPAQLGEKLSVDRIPRLRPVQRQHGDTARMGSWYAADLDGGLQACTVPARARVIGFQPLSCESMTAGLPLRCP